MVLEDLQSWQVNAIAAVVETRGLVDLRLDVPIVALVRSSLFSGIASTFFLVAPESDLRAKALIWGR